MKTIERIYFTLVFLSIASALILPFWFEGNNDLKYDKIADIPAMQVMGYSLLVFGILVVIGILYSIWTCKD